MNVVGTDEYPLLTFDSINSKHGRISLVSKCQANSYSSAGSFVSDLVVNPKDRYFQATGLRGFRPGLTQNGLYKHRR